MTAIRHVFAAASAVCAFAFAAGLPLAQAQAQAQNRHAASAYAVCEDGQQDRAACRREIGAVRQRAPQDPASADFQQNALRRCQAHGHHSEARQACEERMRRGQHTHMHGSVMGGGVLYEHQSGPGAQ